MKLKDRLPSIASKIRKENWSWGDNQNIVLKSKNTQIEVSV